MKVVEAIAKVLKAEGVEVLFAYPVNPIIEAAAAENIRTVIVRQERIGLRDFPNRRNHELSLCKCDDSTPGDGVC